MFCENIEFCNAVSPRNEIDAVDAAAACNAALAPERTQAPMWIFDDSAHAVGMTGGDDRHHPVDLLLHRNEQSTKHTGVARQHACALTTRTNMGSRGVTRKWT